MTPNPAAARGRRAEEPSRSRDGLVVIRASSASAYVDCQLRAAVGQLRAYFEGHGHRLARPRSNIGALVGTGYHASLELALTDAMMGRGATPEDAMADAGHEAFAARLRQDREEGSALLLDGATPTIESAASQLRRMAASFRRHLLPRLRPVAVESRIECDVTPGVVLSGQADLLHLDAGGGGGAASHTLHDAKSGRRRQVASRHMPQQGCYSLLIRSRGHAVDRGQIDAMMRVLPDRPQPPPEELPYPIAAAEAVATSVLADFSAKAAAFVRDGDPGVFVPNPGSILCAAAYCPAHGTTACAATRGDD